jgi:hypothetical protein
MSIEKVRLPINKECCTNCCQLDKGIEHPDYAYYCEWHGEDIACPDSTVCFEFDPGDGPFVKNEDAS